MTIALIDNGSLEPAAHRGLLKLAAELSAANGAPVHAVSWKHSDRIHPALLDGRRADVLASWLPRHYGAGEREFVLVPYFISAQGSVGSWLRRDVDCLGRELRDARFQFTKGLSMPGGLVRILADHIRDTLRTRELVQPPIIVVDHGGPSPASARLRNDVARELRLRLGDEAGPLAAASLEGDDHPHNHPLFANVLGAPGFDRGDVVIAPLFLSPGRHAGPRGDLARIALAAEGRLTHPPLRCHFTALVGTHPNVLPALQDSLSETLQNFHIAA